MFFERAKDKTRTTLLSYNAGGPNEVSWNPLEKSKYKPFVDAVINEARKYLIEMKYDNYTPIVSSMWLNEMSTGSEQPLHTHYGATMSGCFYVDSPIGAQDIWFLKSDMNVCSPYLQFAKEIHKGNAVQQSVSTEKGNIVMFPSNLHHMVPGGKFDGLRRSIAFDIVFKAPEARFREGKSVL